MDISNLKEEDLHPEAKELLAELRHFYVENVREVGLKAKERAHLYHIEIYGDLGCNHHKTRAYQIALAELQLTKLIRG